MLFPPYPRSHPSTRRCDILKLLLCCHLVYLTLSPGSPRNAHPQRSETDEDTSVESGGLCSWGLVTLGKVCQVKQQESMKQQCWAAVVSPNLHPEPLLMTANWALPFRRFKDQRWQMVVTWAVQLWRGLFLVLLGSSKEHCKEEIVYIQCLPCIQ